MKKNEFLKLPKIELHLHLDCSLSYKVVKRLSPEISYEVYRKSFVAPGKCIDLADYIKRALCSIELMQTKEQLELVTLDLFEQLKTENVIYAEIRFAPLEHLKEGLAPKEVVETVIDSAKKGSRITGVDFGIILCTLRHYSENQSMDTVKLVSEFNNKGVVGFDIASDEAGFPIDNHISAFTFAREHNINCTAHAGEAKGADSVWETLQNFRPSRIGHGVRSIEDPELMDFLKSKKIHLEVCPTSNVQTNVVDNIENHPVNKIYQTGVSLSINTDGRTVSDVTLSDQYETLEQYFGWEKAHFLKCNLEAIKHSFVSENKKVILRERIIKGFEKY